MRYLLIVSIILLLICSAKAQKGANHLKIHSGLEVPLGIFDEAYKSGWGIYVTDYIELGKGGSLLVSTGIANWQAKDADIKVGLSLNRVGLRWFVYKDLYFQTDMGIAIFLKDWAKGSRFTYGGGTGYLIKTNGKGAIDLNVRINRFSYRTWMGFGAGYQFKL